MNPALLNKPVMTSVDLESLGLCEHCGTLMTMATLPSEAIDAEWRCPNCRKKLTHKSFGYESAQGEKVKWVGPNGKWTTKKPTEDFNIGSWHIYIRPPSPYW